jgi:hypothetical protein
MRAIASLATYSIYNHKESVVSANNPANLVMTAYERLPTGGEKARQRSGHFLKFPSCHRFSYRF